MQFFQSKGCVTIISNDNFIVGLLTGYCVANHFTIQSEPRTTASCINTMNSGCKVIIIDLRRLTLERINTYLGVLKMIHDQYSIPICAIYNDDSMPLSLMQPCIDYYKDDVFIEGFEAIIAKYVSNLIPAFVNKRVNARRLGNERRRLKSDRRGSGAERRVSFAAHSSNQRNVDPTIDESNTEHDVLGVFEIDHNSHSVSLRGNNLNLSGKEYKLFNLLAKDVDKVCTTEKIIEHLWPSKRRANKSDLYQYMYLLRKKVEVDPDHPYWILTVKGVGYKLNVE